MDLKILRYFLTVANTKNITKAADLLHITQPTLSRQLIVLEENLGVHLFIKEKRSIELTAEGRLLKKRAREILDLADQTSKELVDPNSLISGSVAVGTIESSGSEKLYELMGPFSQEYPNVTFNLYTGSTDDILEKMDQGIIDICMLLDPVDTSKYNVIRLPSNEQWGVLLHVDDELAQKEAVTIQDLCKVPVLLPSRPAVKSEVENWFGKTKYYIKTFGTYNLLPSALLCVEKGLGYPICLNNSLIENHQSICFRPISPAKTIQSVILWKKNRNFNSVTELFVKTVYRHFNASIY
ncbi:LysR family transcriptional regulator [Vibrio mangrovi]|uniref:HTH-type transcriptional regulator GltC n=1 Tax=Vibrio mangrovi TaxID=474394 RepID=A0A1Y6ITT1_9VIBR|nr:LysR family transcriptional regulator [Vibrio mangrovi]MDW6004796.1 LysR family transcriptional regulator [Vibrio mangrovi]SMS01087.1 HTH-type transcriptional regulator GltC [Vibrio mangrovi]